MKILAIASAGGHWVQLLRLRPAFDGHEIVYACTKKGFEKMVPEGQFALVADANRSSLIGLISSFNSVRKVIAKIRPDCIITTGAAPGLMAVFLGKMNGCKTIWVDSIANVEKLSLSGRIASSFVDVVYTQWPELADGKIIFKGNVLG